MQYIVTQCIIYGQDNFFDALNHCLAGILLHFRNNFISSVTLYADRLRNCTSVTLIPAASLTAGTLHGEVIGRSGKVLLRRRDRKTFTIILNIPRNTNRQHPSYPYRPYLSRRSPVPHTV